MNISEFLTVLSSEQPTPGGGSVAGLANCCAAALLHMFCKISLKTASSEDKDIFYKLLPELQDIIYTTKSLIDTDAQAFDNVMNAFKLPKETEQEKDFRKQKIQDAFYEASLIPMENIKCAVKLLEITNELTGKGTPNAVSDFKCARYMAQAAYQCARENVLINLNSIKDETRRTMIMTQLSIFEQKL